jgi:hypothetical protein
MIETTIAVVRPFYTFMLTTCIVFSTHFLRHCFWYLMDILPSGAVLHWCSAAAGMGYTHRWSFYPGTRCLS